jgi:hypothetical protein
MLQMRRELHPESDLVFGVVVSTRAVHQLRKIRAAQQMDCVNFHVLRRAFIARLASSGLLSGLVLEVTVGRTAMWTENWSLSAKEKCEIVARCFCQLEEF